MLRSVSMNINSFDVSAQIAQIMQDKPDIVGVAANYSQAVTVLRELRRQHFAGRAIGSQLFSDPNLVKVFGNDANGMLFVSGFWRHKNAQTEAFAERFMKAMVTAGYPERSPHHVDAQAYDTVFLLKQAIERSRVTGDPGKLAQERVALRDALKGIRSRAFSVTTSASTAMTPNCPVTSSRSRTPSGRYLTHSRRMRAGPPDKRRADEGGNNV